jgi:hypothetical protein
MKLLAGIMILSSLVFRPLASAEVLIVADEFPAMQVVAEKLKTEEQITSKVMVVYIHGPLLEKAEDAFIDYARNGGKLVLLHHSISSGKRKNSHWFSFLGVSLPQGDLEAGGYKWIEGVSFSLVNLSASLYHNESADLA